MTTLTSLFSNVSERNGNCALKLQHSFLSIYSSELPYSKSSHNLTGVKPKQDRQYTCNATLTHVRESLFPWKSNKYQIFVCVFARLGTCMRECGCPGAWACACACARVALLTSMQRVYAISCRFRPLCLHLIFRHYLTNGTIVERNLLNIKYIFWFSLQLLFKSFLILRIIQRDIVINVRTSSWKSTRCCCRILMKLEFSRQIFEKRPNIKFRPKKESRHITFSILFAFNVSIFFKILCYLSLKQRR